MNLKWNILRYFGFVNPTLIDIAKVDGMTGYWRAIPPSITYDSTTTNVSIANDLSGNERNMSQTVMARQPNYITGVVNGAEAFSYTLANQELLFSQGHLFSDFISVTQYTAYIVFKLGTVTTDSGIASSNHRLFHNPANKWGIYARNNAGQLQIIVMHNDGAQKTISFNVTAGQEGILECRYDGVNLYATLNGGAEQSIAAGNIVFPTSNLQIGSTGATTAFDGYIAECGIANVDLDTNTRSLIREELNRFYQIY